MSGVESAPGVFCGDLVALPLCIYMVAASVVLYELDEVLPSSGVVYCSVFVFLPVPTLCPRSSIYGVGGHSVLLSITEDIAAKVALRPGDPHVRHEQTIFELLDQTSCPSIIRIYLRCPKVTFMQLLSNGTLYQRMTLVNKPPPILQ